VWRFAIMIKTQIQLPDQLYYQAKAIAEQHEWSLAEVVRRGIEHMAVVYTVKETTTRWEMPILKSEFFAANFDQLDFKAIVATEELKAQP